MKKSVKKTKAKQSATRQRVLVNFVLDKSGSMFGVATDTIGGFNNYIAELKKEAKVDYLFSLTMFDTDFINTHVAAKIEAVRDLDSNSYYPNGGTALYDAIGSTVKAVESSDAHYDKVITVIMTDGHENSSREWKLADIKALIERKEKEGNWTFVFLGATPDAWDVGVTLGVAVGNVANYEPAKSEQVYASMAVRTNTMSASLLSSSRSLFSDTGGDSIGIRAAVPVAGATDHSKLAKRVRGLVGKR